jgi:hypothetical protein
VKVEYKIIDVNTLKRKGIQVLNEEQIMNMKLKLKKLVWAYQVAKVAKYILYLKRRNLG